MNLFILGTTQSIINLKSDSSSDNTILITWSLQEPIGMYSDLTFSVYFSLGEYETLAGTTKDLSYEITGIPTNVNYSIRVESQIPFSTQTISATLYHYLGSVQTTTQYTVVYSNNDNTTTIPITRAGGAGAAGAARAAPLLTSDSISSMGRGSAEPPKILLPYRQWPPHFLWASDAPAYNYSYS